MSSITTKGKGKARDLGDYGGHIPLIDPSNTGSGSDSESSCDESDPKDITPEYLESLIEKAKAGVRNRRRQKIESGIQLEEEEILLDDTQDQKSLPALDPGPTLPRPYFKISTSRSEASSVVYDLDEESILRSAPSQPSAPPPPPELNKDKKPLTKRQKKEQKSATTGPNWFDLPAPAGADLPKLYREVEALRLRNSLDPKRFYRKEEGEGKGIKGLPKHFAIGTIIPSSTPFGTASADNLTRAQRKRTVVDELVDDAEAKRYAKRKFLDLQGVRGEKGRGTWARKMAGRRGKW